MNDTVNIITVKFSGKSIDVAIPCGYIQVKSGYIKECDLYFNHSNNSFDPVTNFIWRKPFPENKYFYNWFIVVIRKNKIIG